MQQQERETPVLDEDDLDVQHLHEEPEQDDSHPVSLIQSLMAAGVTRYDAINAVSTMTCNTHMAPTTFCEVYGRGEIVNTANEARRNLNLKGLRTFDLRVRRDDGVFWDLSKAQHRREALDIIEREDPDWVVCGPPCTAFSALNHWLNYPRLPKEHVDATIAEGIVHVRSACRLYKSQITRFSS